VIILVRRVLHLLELSLTALVLTACNPPRQPSNDLVFVSNEGTDQVTIIDGATGRIDGALPTGKRPRGMGISPDRKTLYVAASDSNRIEAWDIAARKLMRILHSGPDPERFAVSPDGKTIYVANEDNSLISFLDIATDKVTHEVKVGAEPEGVGVSTDGKLLVTTSETTSTAHFIDAANGEMLDSEPVGTRPRYVLFLDGGKTVWVSSEQRGRISIFDAATHKLIGTIDLVQQVDTDKPVQTVEMAATRDERRVFVGMGRTNMVAEIDPKTRSVVRTFPTGERTWSVALSPDETRLYAVSGISGTLTIIDIQRNKLRHTVKLPGRPWGAIAVAR
jgi:PQQ-dependent catabolism-associated beta-propeller protein